LSQSLRTPRPLSRTQPFTLVAGEGYQAPPRIPRNPEPSNKLANPKNKYRFNKKTRSAHATQKNPKYYYTKKDYQTPQTYLDFSRIDLISEVQVHDIITLSTLNQLYPALT